MNAQTQINPLTLVWELREATIAARERLHDSKLASQVKSGLIQIVRAIPKPGKSTFDIVPVSCWMSYSDAVQYVNNMNSTDYLNA